VEYTARHRCLGEEEGIFNMRGLIPRRSVTAVELIPTVPALNDLARDESDDHNPKDSYAAASCGKMSLHWMRFCASTDIIHRERTGDGRAT